MANRPLSLSLCMIVRNGERSLQEALASAQPFVDEMVVVDTGSTDATRRIAEECGARIFDFEWCDDFSAARNYSLEQATGDWIFWMDADDVLPATSGQELRRLSAEHPQRDATFWVTVEEEAIDRRGKRRVMGHSHVKLFPRHPEMRFCYRVHEQIAPAARELGLPILRTKAVVKHVHSDRTEAGERAKLERNLRLGLLDLEERPDDPFVWLNVGKTYLFMPAGLPTAIDYLQRCLGGFRSGSPNQLNAFLYLGQALGTSGDRKQEEEVYRQALETFPDDVMLLLRLGGLCEASNRSEEAAQCYATILERGKVRESVGHVREPHVRAALRLGQLHVTAGRPGQAESVWRRFVTKFPDAIDVRQALGKLLEQFPSIIVRR